MNNEKPYLEGYEINQLKMCISNIKDKLNAIDIESLTEKPYKHYIKEKIDSILWDAKVIENLTNTQIEND